MSAREHVATVTSAPTAKRMGYRATCCCGWESKRMRTVGEASFDARLHERAEDVKARVRAEVAVPAVEAEPDDIYGWRCPDCGMGMTKVHMTVQGLVGCGKPPGYWTPEAEPDGSER